MKVLWLTPDKPANISVGRQRIASALRRRGFDVTLRGTTLRTVWQSLRERAQYDVVIGTTRSGALAGTAISAFGGPTLIIDHIDPIRQFAETAPLPLAEAVRHCENLSFRRSEATLFVYEEERNRVTKHAPRVVKTALGVDVDRFREPSSDVLERAGRTLESYDLRENVAIYVGGLEPIYRIETVLEAAELLDDWSVVLAGTGSLEPRVREAHDGCSIVYLGVVPHDEVPGLLYHADVGISLVDDPHTLKVLEYGSAGLPVVQLDGRARQRFSDRVQYCGDSPAQLARTIRVAADSDPEPLASFVSAFDWATIAETYADVITSVK